MGVSATRAVAALWGFAEATLFFILPDVYLSAVALRDGREALRACFFALAGALVGGTLMLLWGRADPWAAEAALDAVPAVSGETIARVAGEISQRGVWATLWGPLKGTPYKIYAVESGALARGLLGFLAVSVPARLLRFLALTGVAAWLARQPLAGWSLASRRLLHAVVWTAVYGVYFALFWD